jgi:hypothetical protein
MVVKIMFNFLMFILWIASLIMMFVDFHWGWLVAFILTTLYFIIRIADGSNGGSFTFIDFGGFDGFGD